MASGATTQTFTLRFLRALARFFVRLGRVFWARGSARQEELRPAAQLESQADGSWRSTGRDPFFTIAKTFSPGWLRVKARLQSDRGGLAQFFWDTGEGFGERESVFLSDAFGDADAVQYVSIKQSTRALRFDPTDLPMTFKLLHFSATPLSDLRMWCEALIWKIDDMRTRRNFSRSIKYGFKLLLSFNLKEFRQKLFPPDVSNPGQAYTAWRANNAITPERRETMRATMASWSNPPVISLIMPVYNVPEEYLRKAVDSVLSQTYGRWELCIADDKSSAPHIRPVLEEYARKDARIKVVFRETNGHISAASNSALALATGEFVGTLDNDDELAEHALFEVAGAIVADPSLDFIYSDEDKIDMKGRHVDPFFKPDWSPEYFLACMYTCHLGVYRRALVNAIGGFRSEFDNAQDYDLVLRIVARTKKIRHIPDVLYHWRMLPTSTAANSGAKSNAHSRAQAALQAHLADTRREGSVEQGPTPGFHRVRFKVPESTKASIVIPTAGKTVTLNGEPTWFALKCVESIRAKTQWKNYEIVLVDNNDMDPELARRIDRLDVNRVHFTEKFNLATKMNFGARLSRNEHLVFMNDDIEIDTPGWLEAMLEFSQQPEIGAVGAKLLFPNGRIQHAGVLVIDAKPGHGYYNFPGTHPGYFLSNSVHRNAIAVTGACLMTRKEVFDSVGGFTEAFPLNYNDVDYCLKLLDAGRRIVYTPYAQLFHHESVSRQKGVERWEVELFKKLWLEKFPDDPFFNPQLMIENGAYIVRA